MSTGGPLSLAVANRQATSPPDEFTAVKPVSVDKGPSDIIVPSSEAEPAEPSQEALALVSLAATPTFADGRYQLPLLQELSAHSHGAEAEALTAAIVQAFGSAGELLPVTAAAVAWEAEDLGCKAAVLFRRPSMCTKLITVTTRVYGAEYIERTISPLIDRMLETPTMSYEVRAVNSLARSLALRSLPAYWLLVSQSQHCRLVAANNTGCWHPPLRRQCPGAVVPQINPDLKEKGGNIGENRCLLRHLVSGFLDRLEASIPHLPPALKMIYCRIFGETVRDSLKT